MDGTCLSSGLSCCIWVHLGAFMQIKIILLQEKLGTGRLILLQWMLAERTGIWGYQAAGHGTVVLSVLNICGDAGLASSSASPRGPPSAAAFAHNLSLYPPSSPHAELPLCASTGWLACCVACPLIGCSLRYNWLLPQVQLLHCVTLHVDM